jgi:hypothetical protein
VVWHEKGKDDLRGKAEVIRYLEQELRPKTVVSELLEVSTFGDRVRGVDRSKMAGLPDREEEHRCVDYFRFDDQSNIAEIWYCAEQLPATG